MVRQGLLAFLAFLALESCDPFAVGTPETPTNTRVVPDAVNDLDVLRNWGQAISDRDSFWVDFLTSENFLLEGVSNEELSSQTFRNCIKGKLFKEVSSSLSWNPTTSWQQVWSRNDSTTAEFVYSLTGDTGQKILSGSARWIVSKRGFTGWKLVKWEETSSSRQGITAYCQGKGM